MQVQLKQPHGVWTPLSIEVHRGTPICDLIGQVQRSAVRGTEVMVFDGDKLVAQVVWTGDPLRPGVLLDAMSVR